MDSTTITELFADLLKRSLNLDLIEIKELPPSGSYRRYFRIKTNKKNIIGTYNADYKENKAFIAFSKSFYNSKLSVPAILALDLEKNIYLQDDLGDTTLYSYLTANCINNEFSTEIKNLYKNILSDLCKIQIIGGKEIDYSLCYPRSDFDYQSMMWDLNYFKYMFLKLAKIPFDEQLLENDFNNFISFLLGAKSDYFMFRDFQSRNIMISEEKLFYIDYQGGRRGALQYDVASLLFDSKANIPYEIREELLEFYIEQASQLVNFDKEIFKKHYYGFVLIRLMQAMGAFGFRGLHERKQHFIDSIPFAAENMRIFIERYGLPEGFNELNKVLNTIALSEELRNIGKTDSKLKVTVQSFSYMNSYPIDNSGNGGGFVFDCRALPNPGRLPEYKQLTGKDLPVIEFLEKQSEVHDFLNSIKQIIANTINTYIARKFENLQISFGCTGGQHRSVYCAEILTQYINQNFNVQVICKHQQFGTIKQTLEQKN